MAKNPALNQRFIDLINRLIELGEIESPAELARMFKVKPQYISRVLKGLDPVSKTMRKYFQEHYGEMLKSPLKIVTKDELPRMTNNNGLPNNPRDLQEIQSDPDGKQIPFIDTDVYASFTPSLSDAVTLSRSTFVNIPIFSHGEVAIMVTGHSMKGYINHGDFVILKRLWNLDSIMYGEAHVVVTKIDNIKSTKFLKPSRDPLKLTLVPYNIEQFDPHDIRKDDILEIYRVLGSFRSH